MAWIESHQKLKEDPKLYDFIAYMNFTKAEAIGRLHMLWWWCVDHAEDGDLRKFNDSHLALAVELNSNQGKEFVEALVTSGFLEREPYFRIVNWWKFIGRFLQTRYRHYPERWQFVKDLYKNNSKTVSKTVSKTNPPNLTKPNLTRPDQTKDKDYCSEPCAGSEPLPPPEAFLSFPVLAPPGNWVLTKDKLAEYRQTYPGVDVAAEMRKARQWCIDNPKRRKTRTGITKFMGGWLARVQNRGGQTPGARGALPPNYPRKPSSGIVATPEQAARFEPEKPAERRTYGT